MKKPKKRFSDLDQGVHADLHLGVSKRPRKKAKRSDSPIQSARTRKGKRRKALNV